MSNKNNQDAKTIGARFRSARSLVPNLNRKSFCERHGINRYTMQSWENGLHVSKGKNVEKFIDALAREGIFCTSEWLIDGVGEPARPMNQSVQSNDYETQDLNQVDETIDTAIKLLQKQFHHVGAQLIKYIIKDQSMAPKFVRGDIVLAKELSGPLSSAHQKYCVISLTPDKLLVRKVLVIKDNLLLLALDDLCPIVTLRTECKIYEIVWHVLQQSL